MPNTPRLSELPGFLPLGEPGSPERRACVVGTFGNHQANRDFVRYLVRECRPAYTPLQTTPVSPALPEKAQSNAF